MTLERPRPIVVEYSNGTRELHCSCGRVTTLAGPTCCQFCGWSSGAKEFEKKGEQARIESAALTRTTSAPELRPRTVLDDIDELKERKRTYVKTGRGDWGQLRGTIPLEETCARGDGGAESIHDQTVVHYGLDVGHVPSGLSALSPRAAAPRLIRAQEIPAIVRAPRPWIQHTTPRNAAVLTAADDVGVPSGLGTGWPCRGHIDQIGGRRCVRCSVSRDLSYVWRNAAGGSPGAFRYLCPGCLAEYRRLGLVGESRTHVNAFSEATSGYGARV